MGLFLTGVRCSKTDLNSIASENKRVRESNRRNEPDESGPFSSREKKKEGGTGGRGGEQAQASPLSPLSESES